MANALMQMIYQGAGYRDPALGAAYDFQEEQRRRDQEFEELLRNMHAQIGEIQPESDDAFMARKRDEFTGPSGPMFGYSTGGGAAGMLGENPALAEAEAYLSGIGRRQEPQLREFAAPPPVRNSAEDPRAQALMGRLPHGAVGPPSPDQLADAGLEADQWGKYAPGTRELGVGSAAFEGEHGGVALVGNRVPLADGKDEDGVGYQSYALQARRAEQRGDLEQARKYHDLADAERAKWATVRSDRAKRTAMARAAKTERDPEKFGEMTAGLSPGQRAMVDSSRNRMLNRENVADERAADFQQRFVMAMQQRLGQLAQSNPALWAQLQELQQDREYKQGSLDIERQKLAQGEQVDMTSALAIGLLEEKKQELGSYDAAYPVVQAILSGQTPTAPAAPADPNAAANRQYTQAAESADDLLVRARKLGEQGRSLSEEELNQLAEKHMALQQAEGELGDLEASRRAVRESLESSGKTYERWGRQYPGGDYPSMTYGM